MISLRKKLCFALAVLLLIGACSCSVLDAVVIKVEPRGERPPAADEKNEYSAREPGELQTIFENIVRSYGYAATITFPTEFSDSVEAAIATAVYDFTHSNALGSFAVERIKHNPAEFYPEYSVAVFEFEYKRTEEVVNTATRSANRLISTRAVNNNITSTMKRYGDRLFFTTELSEINTALLLEAAEQSYYDAPLDIAVRPILHVMCYPADAPFYKERIFEITFDYGTATQQQLALRTEYLRQNAARIANAAGGASDVSVLRDLLDSLSKVASYSEALEAVYPPQSFAATAYGTVSGDQDSVSEGYAMAFKALCDVLNISCAVRSGEVNGQLRFWNVVIADGQELEAFPYLYDLTDGAEGFLPVVPQVGEPDSGTDNPDAPDTDELPPEETTPAPPDVTDQTLPDAVKP
ncbi:MAG: hypothetical protein LBQ91_02260 [Oscillospiraceae bacterium]|jgi:hypothetical protein|nr:hypothetical protein [Oscillospiraceae bacterium]